jgi:hypothetical protein
VRWQQVNGTVVRRRARGVPSVATSKRDKGFVADDLGAVKFSGLSK